MFNIEKYLEKFSRNIESSESNKKKVIEIIEKHTQLYIRVENVEIKDYIIYINDSPAIKNKIFIFKTKILEDVEKSLPIKIVDIK